MVSEVCKLICFKNFSSTCSILKQKYLSLVSYILILLAISSVSFAQTPDSTGIIKAKGISDSLDNKNISNSDSVQTQKVRKLIPIQKDFTVFNFNDNIISKRQQQFKDYRFAGDLLNYLPYGTLLDLGWLGQPSEMKFYDLGFNNITYLSDGINFNNRLTNSLDLNLLQSENLDFIGVSTLPRGFLFDNLNNPVAVYFKETDTLEKKPVTKIRYFQGKNEEAYINGVFKTRVYRNLYGAFQFTSTAIDNGYENTDFSAWKASATLKYLVNNDLNLIAKYNHVRSYTGLFGGVNLDSIKAIPGITNTDDVLYNRILAPVEFTTRYQKITRHNFELSALLKLSGNSLTDVSLYHQYHSTKFRQNEKFKERNVKRIFNDDDYTAYGIKVSHQHKFNFVSIYLFGNYEKINNNVSNYELNVFDKNKYSYLSYGGVVSSSLLNDILVPSVFVKQTYSELDNKYFSGFGADVNLNFAKRSKLYFGISKYSKPVHTFKTNLTGITSDVNILEMKLMFGFARLNGSIGYFRYSATNSLNPFVTLSDDFLKTVEFIDFSVKDNLTNSGIGLSLNHHAWKILTEVNIAYYFKNEHPDGKFSLFAGIYYVDTLFQNNLHLKAGFNFKSSAVQSNIIYDFEKQLSTLINRSQHGSPAFLLIPDYSSTITNQLDIFIAGEIQEAATVYFVLENIFDTKYYLIKYYPKQEMTFRFGFSWEFLN